MFGYVTLYRKGLANAEMDRYQAYYCGLCRTLGRRYGRTGQLALSYDMAFVAILLTALYDTPTAFSEGRCVPHPLKKRPRADNELLDYAADMTAALAYYNFLDDWQDDHRRASLAQAQKLEPSLPALRERWPRQLQTMAAQLDRLNALESAGNAVAFAGAGGAEHNDVLVAVVVVLRCYRHLHGKAQGLCGRQGDILACLFMEKRRNVRRCAPAGAAVLLLRHQPMTAVLYAEVNKPRQQNSTNSAAYRNRRRR